MRSAALLAAWSLALIALPFATPATPLPAAIEEVRDHLRNGDIDAAVDAGESATEQLADDAHAWLWAGRAYGRQAMAANLLMKAKWAGRTRDAYEKAVALDPKLVDARFDLMQYYLMAPSMLGGGRDKAEAQAKAIAELDASMGKLAASGLAQADQQPERAEALVREALSLNPDNDRARLSISGLLQNREQWDELHALWNDRLQVKPDDALAIYQLGRWSALTGKQLEQGLAHLDAFIRAGVIPENLSIAAAQWRRGQILEKLGQLTEARNALEVAMLDRAVARQAEADLERVRKARG